MALEHLFDTHELDRCVELVTELLLPTYLVGQVSTVERWLDRLGDEAIKAYPPLAVLAGWIAALRRRHRRRAAMGCVHRDCVVRRHPRGRDGVVRVRSGHAALPDVSERTQQAVADADLAMAEEPPWSPWRGQALGMAGQAYLLAGDNGTARRLLEELVAGSASDTNADAFVTSLAELAVLAMADGRWREAADHVELALATIAEHRLDDYPPSVTALAAAARVALHDGDTDRANQQATRAMRARGAYTFALPGMAVRARLQLALVYRGLGDSATARHLLREIDDILLHRPSLGALVDEVSALRSLLDATLGGSPRGRPAAQPGGAAAASRTCRPT